ncbi:MAG: AAA family ATPase [Solirubrobacterales bacterium]|nr:AAA family ATPase [Solirubrobacterales bacterium]
MSVSTQDSCPGCGAISPDGARFCGACGTSLDKPATCPACAAENPSGQGFCNSCGAGLESENSQPPAPVEARPEVDGERKQVTVLFADVKGSMDLAESIDPEEWSQIMQRFFSLLSDGVRRFEGTVDKFTGDGIMALFGAPITHEDHAARACFAALHIGELVAEYATELRRAQGLSFSVRIGINSGEVVAGAIGEDEQREYTAVGHTVGLAQRMESLAEPGKAYLTESTAKLAGGYLDLKDLGEFEVKGASRPIGVFELVGIGSARSRLDISRERGLSRFVGRSKEMAVLEGAFEQAKEGRGAVVGIVAEPGIGKSRLCHEFAERCRARGVDVNEAQAQAHGHAVSFMPVREMMRGYFGIEDRDSERLAREKIAGRLLLLDPDFSDDLPLIFDFLAVPDPERPSPQVSAEARKRLLRGVIRRLYRVPGRTDVTLSLIEDLHWMDEGSKDLVAEMVSAVERTAPVVVLNFRPEYQADWFDSPIFQRLSLVPLGLESTRELLADLAGNDRSIDGLAELIHERTGGNPFFIEEVVRELAEVGNLEGGRGAYQLTGPIGDTSVPATVQVILAARIDRLETAKTLLQAAAVIGSEVSEPALRMVTGLNDSALTAGLKELIAAGFLYEAEIYPERVLAFSHPLTLEVAYGSQLSEQRAASHAAAARALIELNPERHDELSALIARHFEQGGELLEGARWNARAAHRAGFTQPRDALRLWGRVADLAAELPEDEETSALGVNSRLLQLSYSWRLGMAQDRIEVLEEEAKKIATRSGDLGSLALLKYLESVRPGRETNSRDLIALTTEAVSLADESGDMNLRMALHALASYPNFFAGDFDAAERMVDEALDLAGNDYGVGSGIVVGCPYAFCLTFKGNICRDRGDFDAAQEYFDSALKIASDQGDLEAGIWARGGLSWQLFMLGRTDDALRLAQRNRDISERLGDVFSRHFALLCLGWVHCERGEYEPALDFLESADRLYREAMGGGGEVEPLREATLADALLGLGRIPEALERAERGVTVGREGGLGWTLIPALRIAAKVRDAAGESGAVELLDEAEALASANRQTVELGKIQETRDAVASGSG